MKLSFRSLIQSSRHSGPACEALLARQFLLSRGLRRMSRAGWTTTPDYFCFTTLHTRRTPGIAAQPIQPRRCQQRCRPLPADTPQTHARHSWAVLRRDTDLARWRCNAAAGMPADANSGRANPPAVHTQSHGVLHWLAQANSLLPYAVLASALLSLCAHLPFKLFFP